MLLTCLVFSAFSLADASHATLTNVKHAKAEKHTAHKATKHKVPKRHHASV